MLVGCFIAIDFVWEKWLWFGFARVGIIAKKKASYGNMKQRKCK